MDVQILCLLFFAVVVAASYTNYCCNDICTTSVAIDSPDRHFIFNTYYPDKANLILTSQIYFNAEPKIEVSHSLINFVHFLKEGNETMCLSSGKNLCWIAVEGIGKTEARVTEVGFREYESKLYLKGTIEVKYPSHPRLDFYGVFVNVCILDVIAPGHNACRNYSDHQPIYRSPDPLKLGLQDSPFSLGYERYHFE